MLQNFICCYSQNTGNATGQNKLLSIFILYISNNEEARKKVQKDTFFFA